MVDWTTPYTWTVGEKLRAAQLNTYVRDNSLFLYEAPQVAVRLTATQEVANATDHTVSWDEAVWDSTGGDMWDSGGPSAITIVRDGVYEIVCATLWDDSVDANKRAIFLNVNGSRRRGIQVPAVSPAEVVLPVVTNLEDGDSIDIEVRQLSGAALDLQATRTVMTVCWRSAPPASGE